MTEMGCACHDQDLHGPFLERLQQSMQQADPAQGQLARFLNAT